MSFKLFLEDQHRPFTAYHQTSAENAKNIMSRGFSFKQSAQNLTWFTTDLESLKTKSTYSSHSGAIIKLMVELHNPAGWDEYQRLLLDQIKAQGYDGVLLPEDGATAGFAFDNRSLTPIEIL